MTILRVLFPIWCYLQFLIFYLYFFLFLLFFFNGSIVFYKKNDLFKQNISNIISKANKMSVMLVKRSPSSDFYKSFNTPKKSKRSRGRRWSAQCPVCKGDPHFVDTCDTCMGTGASQELIDKIETAGTLKRIVNTYRGKPKRR